MRSSVLFSPSISSGRRKARTEAPRDEVTSAVSPITEPPLLPRNVAWMERALGHLDQTSVEQLEKVSTLLLISGHFRNEVSLARSLNESSTEDQTAGSSGSWTASKA